MPSSQLQQDDAVTKRSAEMTQAIDHHLAMSLRSVTAGGPAASWPADWPASPDFAEAFGARVMFHGIALALWCDPGKLAGWPEQVRAAIRDEARAQSFWERGHRSALSRLTDVLVQVEVKFIVSKGTALAYSVYSDPAMRRRGDSDVLLANASRKSVRRMLRDAGFRPSGDVRPLQESWQTVCPLGFTHEFDLHWRASASAVLAQALERAGIGHRSIPLPRLHENTRGIPLADNLILIAINRASHQTFGYRSSGAKLYEPNRLIWALDIDLLIRAFAPGDWESLVAAATASGTGPLVADALAFAAATLGSAIPVAVGQCLAAQPGDRQVLEYFTALTGPQRLKRDLTASPGLVAKLRLAGYTLFPGTEVLHERFPQATQWPVAALQGRRLAAGAARLIRARS